MPKSDEAGKDGLNPLLRRVLEVLQENPDGISMSGIAKALNIETSKQIHFNRRVRELYPTHEITKSRKEGEVLYKLIGRKRKPTDQAAISKTLRAAVLHAARGKCAMCGRSVESDGVTLAVDHKLPRTWGGVTDLDNLWALCSTCNEGKRDFFASVDSPELRDAISHKSVHVRIGELLKAYKGEPVESTILDIVAGQEDWQKRLRELRYLGWEIETSKKKLPSGRVRSSYTLIHATKWPADPTAVIRQYERDRANRQ